MAQGTPNYVLTPRNWGGALSAANPNRDGTGTIVDIALAGLVGSRCDYAYVAAIATTTAGAIRFFRKRSGTYTYLPFEMIVSPITPTATTPPFGGIVNLNSFILENGDALAAATNNAELFKVHIQGGDF